MISESMSLGFDRILDSWRRGEHSAQPGIVTEFTDRSVPRVSVQPVYQRVMDGDDEPRTLPIIKDVPVLYPGGGEYMITFDISVGANVLLIVPERSINQWMNTGDVGDPTLSHVCDISDSIAIPVLTPSTDALSPEVSVNTITIGKRDGTVKIQIDNTDILIETTGDVTATGATIATDGSTETKLQNGTDWAVQYTALKSAFDTLKSDFNNFVIWATSHVHPGVTAGAGSTSAPAVPPVQTTADMTGAKVSDVRLP